MINLYGACVRIGRAMGYKRIITYTLESEHGSSVKAANFKYDGIAGGIVWSGKRRNDALPAEMNKERPSKGEVLLTPLALYNTKFRFVKFDRAFFEKYFYSFSHQNIWL